MLKLLLKVLGNPNEKKVKNRIELVIDMTRSKSFLLKFMDILRLQLFCQVLEKIWKQWKYTELPN